MVTLPTTPPTTQDGLRRQITTRHMAFMALSTSIGAGLLVASGQALALAGPASLVIGFVTVGIGATLTMSSLGEMAANLPVSGAFYTYTDRFIGPAAGFAMAWNFTLCWLIVLPFEIIVLTEQISVLFPAAPPAAIVAVFLILVAVVPLFGARGFGEVENWLGMVKACCLTTFIGIALSLTIAGQPYRPDRPVQSRLSPGQMAYGGTFWHVPFRNGFQGFLTVFKVAGMAYGGLETLGLTAAECLRPQRLMRIGTYVTFFRVAFFYVGSLAMLGFVLPADETAITRTGKTSPFQIAMAVAGLRPVEHVITACIVASLVSMSNMAVFSSSRALHALSLAGNAPRFFRKTRGGVPVNATALSLLFGLLAFVGCADGGQAVFSWLLSLAGMANYCTWLAICASHIRFRRATKAQGVSASLFCFRSPFGVWGSYVASVASLCGMVAQWVIAFWVFRGRTITAPNVLMDTIGFIVVILLFVGYLLWQRWAEGHWLFLRPLDKIDLDAGFRGKAETEQMEPESASA